MSEAFLILLREGFEATLIIGILFAYLRKIDRMDMAKPVWGGIAAAIAAATAVGVFVHVQLGSLVGVPRLRSFAGVSIAAGVVLTWMVFWMRRQGRAVKGELQHSIDRALATDSVTKGLFVVAFMAVLREGIETALFLLAASSGTTSGSVLIGGLAGLAVACVLGWGVYAGGRRFDMQRFFKVTGMIVIVFAAGLCAKSVLFLQAAGDLPIGPDVYNLTNWYHLTQASEVGRMLGGLFGWDPRPSLEQVAVWIAYIVPITYLFLRGDRPVRKAESGSAATSSRVVAA